MIEDDTDLEAAASVDYGEFLKKRGIQALVDAPGSIIIEELK